MSFCSVLPAALDYAAAGSPEEAVVSMTAYDRLARGGRAATRAKRVALLT